MAPGDSWLVGKLTIVIGINGLRNYAFLGVSTNVYSHPGVDRVFLRKNQNMFLIPHFLSTSGWWYIWWLPETYAMGLSEQPSAA